MWLKFSFMFLFVIFKNKALHKNRIFKNTVMVLLHFCFFYRVQNEEKLVREQLLQRCSSEMTPFQFVLDNHWMIFFLSLNEKIRPILDFSPVLHLLRLLNE